MKKGKRWVIYIGNLVNRYMIIFWDWMIKNKKYDVWYKKKIFNISYYFVVRVFLKFCVLFKNFLFIVFSFVFID